MAKKLLTLDAYIEPPVAMPISDRKGLERRVSDEMSAYLGNRFSVEVVKNGNWSVRWRSDSAVSHSFQLGKTLKKISLADFRNAWNKFLCDTLTEKLRRVKPDLKKEVEFDSGGFFVEGELYVASTFEDFEISLNAVSNSSNDTVSTHDDSILELQCFFLELRAEFAGFIGRVSRDESGFSLLLDESVMQMGVNFEEAKRFALNLANLKPAAHLMEPAAHLMPPTHIVPSMSLANFPKPSPIIIEAKPPILCLPKPVAQMPLPSASAHLTPIGQISPSMSLASYSFRKQILYLPRIIEAPITLPDFFKSVEDLAQLIFAPLINFCKPPTPASTTAIGLPEPSPILCLPMPSTSAHLTPIGQSTPSAETDSVSGAKKEALARLNTPFPIPFESDDRTLYLGASEVPALTCDDFFKSEGDVFIEKLGIVPGIPNNPAEQRSLGLEYIHVGQALEEPVLRLYLERNPDVKAIDLQTEFVNREGYLKCHVDCLAMNEAGKFIIEAKNVNMFLFKDKWADGPPDYVHDQVQAQMLLSGYDRTVVVTLVGGSRLETFDIYADKERQQIISEKAKIFWESVQLAREDMENFRDYIPDFSGSKHALKTAKQLNALELGSETEIFLSGAESEKVLLQVIDAKNNKKEAAQKCDSYEAAARVILGASKKAKVAGMGEFGLKTRKGSKSGVFYAKLD